MKKLMLIVLTTLLFLNVKAPPISKYYKDVKTHNYWLEQQELKREKELNDFLFHLKLRESADNWTIINKHGYMGLWQIGNTALKDIGLGYITSIKFRKNPHIFPKHLQEIAVKKLLKRNELILKRHKKYIGCTIKGIFITKSGLLAAAHLAGAGNVMKFLESEGNYNFADANGTTVKDYLTEFSNYKF